ncbi:MAG: outer membrane lipoprotein-sorting protein [Treponema sp.]|jgi:outer membrane lipoprotein-sorting protein|nr:outer membrane lipoprotein-sorting protein [Treponema sp.]
MKRIAMVTAALLVWGSSLAGAQDARAIVESARNRIQQDTVSTRSRMVITAKNGSTTERRIDQYSKDGPNGSRLIIVFQSPASVAGTRFLTMDAASGGEDRWIFLPSLGKVRRVAASEGSGSFMGTDFSYDDISIPDRDTDLDTHTLLREETLDGAACHVIQSSAKAPDYQYSKMISWIDKQSYVLYKAEMYDRRGTLVKRMGFSNFKTVQDRLTATQTTVSTVAAGTSTTLYVEIIKYDDPIPESVFTTAYLETGRAR